MRKIKVYKEKQYLIFELDNNKKVKYDFAKKKAIGISGKPVKGLQNQLRGIKIDEIIDSCVDIAYAEFLSFLKRKYNLYISNVGTFLSMIPENAKYEQLFTAGFKADQIPSNFEYGINDLPKSLIKIAKENHIELSNNLVNYWKENIDAHVIGFELSFMSLNNDDILKIYCKEQRFGRSYFDSNFKSFFNIIINEYNYNAKSLLLYFDYLKTHEALENVGYVIRELYDYIKMMTEISDKFEKYPRNFLTTHKIACRNYNRLKKEFEEANFKKQINKDYECSLGDYVFIYPESTQDIKDEAVQQSNCVASYIQDVIDGYCHILFLRKKNQEDKSLVTIEVDPVRNIIVQAKGKFNRDTTEKENKVIEAWNKKFSINKIMEVAA